MSVKCKHSCGTTSGISSGPSDALVGAGVEEQSHKVPQGMWMLLPRAMLPGYLHLQHPQLSLWLSFGQGLCLIPSLPDSISPAQLQAPAATWQPRGRKPSPFSSGNHISPCYNEVLSVIRFQSEQADFLICSDFISLWECLLPLLWIYS